MPAYHQKNKKKSYSIPAQQKAIRRYALEKGYRVIKEFTDIESAGKAGRKQFTKMVEYINKNDNVSAIICHKIDRLYRNFKDYVTIDELGIKTLFVEEEYADNAQGKFMKGIRVLMAKNYLDNLSDEVKKGMYEKLAQGGYPGKAPIGYLNNKLDRTIVVDENNCFYIRLAYELYSSGTYALKELSNKLYAKGFRSPTGRKVSTSQIQKILTNTFYYGLIKYHGKYYPGKHKPLIDKPLFDQVQKELKRKSKPKKQKYSFALRGFMVCGECGKSITAEIQKGHTYYRCTKSSGNCSQGYAREEILEDEIITIFDSAKIDRDILELLIKATKEIKQQEFKESENELKTANKLLTNNNKKRKKLLDGFISGVIPDDIYTQKEKELLDEKALLETQLSRTKQDDDFIFEQIKQFFRIAATAGKLYKSGNIEQKRKLLSLIPSNLVLKDRHIVSYQLKEPFNLLVERPITTDFSKLLGR